MADSSIEWTNKTWNPVSGCTRASAGCDACYAVRMTHRLESMGQAKYTGLTVLNGKGDRHFNGVVRTHDDALTIPLKWKKPQRIFVNSMSDLFHRDVPFEFIDKVFAVMALCPQHTFQVLTKRAERMAEYFHERRHWDAIYVDHERPARLTWTRFEPFELHHKRWPLENVWLGTSVENQQAADERIPHLLKVPAVVRFLSCEPLLGPVSLDGDPFMPGWLTGNPSPETNPRIHWVIVGGESGPGARPFNIEWARSIRDQCKAAGVACFIKQLGAVPYDPSWHGDGTPTGSRMILQNPKGGDWDEWPSDLRVRDFPVDRAEKAGVSRG